ncbi:MAG: dienelactone hydrolase [Rhodospirillales bacterium]|nr:dienelactone hydrolase [Rhodospirillales bacterium]
MEVEGRSRGYLMTFGHPCRVNRAFVDRVSKPGTIALLALSILCAPTTAQAGIVEEAFEVPMNFKTLHWGEFTQNIKVTVFRDTEKAKSPYLILNHGRPVASEMSKFTRARYSQNSRYFVSLGFVVFVPTRVGYGETGGPDMETSGQQCDFSTEYDRPFANAADQVATVLSHAKMLPYVDPTRGLVVGQSFGGTTAMALSTRELPGLAGAVNFAGGAGGNPTTRPENPCYPHRIEKLFEDYGSKAKVPTIWLYSENDRFWGPALPKKWFDAFVKGGGKGKFVPLPPHGRDGHGIFSANPEAWKPAFEAFLREVGF